MSSLPLSMLQGLLHPKQDYDETYLVELPNKEVVTLGQLMTFWVEGHQKIKSALDIIRESKEKIEREPEKENKISSKQEMEIVCPPTVNPPKRVRRNNKNKTEKV